jgi:hypothetical protein
MKLFASVFGLACWFLMTCARTIGKFQMAPSGPGTATDATNAGDLAAEGWRTENWAGLR